MAILTIKFSEFANGGDLSNNKITVGLDALSGTNTYFNNPWTFLPSGSTGSRPVPTSAIFYRLRLNTTLRVYEYYDPISALWIQLSGGSGTVNPGVTNDLAFYAANGTSISPITTANNSVLTTNGSGVPSLQTTLPTGLTIPGATITSSTAALTSGQVAAAPVNPTDITNKAYVDAAVGGDVTSITGTTNQVIASASTGAVTLSLPQDINTNSDVTFDSVTFSNTTKGIVGTTTNNNAATGFVGEFVESNPSGSTNFTTSGTAQNMSQINLGGGDWDVYGWCLLTNGAAVTGNGVVSISTTSNTQASPGLGFWVTGFSTAFLPQIAFVYNRVKLSSPGTVYLVGQSSWTTGAAATFNSQIAARRPR